MSDENEQIRRKMLDEIEELRSKLRNVPLVTAEVVYENFMFFLTKIRNVNKRFAIKEIETTIREALEKEKPK